MSYDDKRILIIDDNPDNLKVLGNMLNENGYHPLFAHSGKKALNAIKHQLPILILLDIMMPDMDGFEICQRLKQDATLKDIPIIFLTAKTEKEHVLEALEQGAVDYVIKPFNNNELINRITTHCELKIAKEKLRQKLEELQIAKLKREQKVAELKQANATKDKFFSIIAHDLGHLFDKLLNLSDLLVDKTVPFNLDKKKQFLLFIQQSSKMGYDLLDNLLAWSRLQIGKLQLKQTTFNLETLINNNIKFLETQITLKKITIALSLKITSVFADENMLDTVIRNLLSNAIKFTPVNGKIELISKPVGSKQIEISIVDTGVGITPENIDKLFQIDMTHTTYGTEQEKGTGLGLILCKEFIEKNGGTINVESEEGKGSRFYIHLPQENVISI